MSHVPCYLSCVACICNVSPVSRQEPLMWCSQGRVLRFSQCFLGEEVAWLKKKNRDCVILCMEMLHDFCVWRDCVIFLTHSLRLHVFFFLEVAWFFLRSGCVIFFVERLRYFFVWTGRLIFFVKRLLDFCVKMFFFSKKKLFGENSFFLKKKFFLESKKIVKKILMVK